MKMTGSRTRHVAVLVAGLVGLLLPNLTVADPPKVVPPGTPVTINVTQAQPASLPVTITLRERHGHATPRLSGCVHTGGGNVDVQQPTADTFVITMTGVAVAYGAPCGGASAAMTFDLEQCFDVVFENTKVKKAKLTMESRVIGLLRSHGKGGSASFSDAGAVVGTGPAVLATVNMQPHSVAGGENLSLNDHEGPVTATLGAGKHNYHQRFTVSACAPKCLLPCKAPSAEFAPDPALNPLWISTKEPFRGAAKKDFGFQVTVKVADDTENGDDKNGDDKKDKDKKDDKDKK